MPLIDRIGPGKTLTFAALVAAVRWTILAGTPSLGVLLALQPLHAITFGSMWLSVVSVLKREVGEKDGDWTRSAHDRRRHRVDGRLLDVGHHLRR